MDIHADHGFSQARIVRITGFFTKSCLSLVLVLSPVFQQYSFILITGFLKGQSCLSLACSRIIMLITGFSRIGMLITVNKCKNTWRTTIASRFHLAVKITFPLLTKAVAYSLILFTRDLVTFRRQRGQKAWILRHGPAFLDSLGRVSNCVAEILPFRSFLARHSCNTAHGISKLVTLSVTGQLLGCEHSPLLCFLIALGLPLLRPHSVCLRARHTKQVAK